MHRLCETAMTVTYIVAKRKENSSSLYCVIEVDKVSGRKHMVSDNYKYPQDILETFVESLRSL